MNSDIRSYVIDLLERSPERDRKIAVLHFELDHFSGVLKDETIEAMALSHSDGTGRSGGRISDKTFYIALNYQSQVDKMNADAKEEIVKQLVELEQEKKRLDYYISLLDERQAEVITLSYFKGVPQNRVAKKLAIVPRTVRRIKDEAVDKLVELYSFAENFIK